MTDQPSRDAGRRSSSQMDHELGDAIARRTTLVEAIVDEKMRSGLPVRDREREQAVLREAVKRGKRQGVPQELVEQISHAPFDHSITLHRTRFAVS